MYGERNNFRYLKVFIWACRVIFIFLVVLENLIKVERCLGNKFNFKLWSLRYRLIFRKRRGLFRFVMGDIEYG